MQLVVTGETTANSCHSIHFVASVLPCIEQQHRIALHLAVFELHSVEVVLLLWLGDAASLADWMALQVADT